MSGDLFGNRLLVIDDEPWLARLVKRVAESLGFEVIATDDPAAFIRTARQWKPTVIVLDLNIPGMDGIQLLRSLAADKCAAHVVLASGADARILEAAQQLGRERGLTMSDMLHKPVRVETLRQLLAGFRPVSKNLLATDLARAIVADELFLEYQPKLDCRSGRITGVEALVRWRHPVHGIVPPDRFVALAEENTLIHHLTNWVVAAAAAQGAAWRDEGAAVDVAVNISAKDIEDMELPERLHRQCRNGGFEPSSMILELTETGAMREAVQMMDVLTRLRLKGFRLAIDDFGVGYSSLVQLQRMPFSEAKVDRSFVMNMTNNSGCRVIAEVVIDLARRLGMKSVAEGVEDGIALNMLIDLGCDMAQGYHISRPLAAEMVPRFVRDYHSATGKTAA